MKEAVYPATCAGYTRLMTENETRVGIPQAGRGRGMTDAEKIAAARARWEANEAAWRRARAAEVARNLWSRSYPGGES